MNFQDVEIDAHDKATWYRSTILKSEVQNIFGRDIQMAHIAFRVYRQLNPGPQVKSDERGTFEGWSIKFDEWIPVYSPRLAQYETKVGKSGMEDIDLEEDLDLLIKPADG